MMDERTIRAKVKTNMPVAPGVLLDVIGSMGYQLHGKKAALIASGLVCEDWFPNGERDSRGRTLRHKKLFRDGRRIESRDWGNDRFSIYVNWSAGDQEALDAICGLETNLQNVGSEAGTSAKLADPRLKDKIASVPSNVVYLDDFRCNREG
jgi:hypothetical protein